MPASSCMCFVQHVDLRIHAQMSHDRGCGSSTQDIADFPRGTQNAAGPRELRIRREQRFVAFDVVGVAVRAERVAKPLASGLDRNALRLLHQETLASPDAS